MVYKMFSRKRKSLLRKVLKIISIASLQCFSLVAFAQDNNYKLPTVTPVSPDAASLGQYVQSPMSFYNGVPQIDIPLYTINYKNIAVPISISYNASGIKVQDIASSIGTGWSLNAGGSISRIVRGKPDEITDGYISGQKNVQKIYNDQISGEPRRLLINRITIGEVDAEPDIFIVSLPGFSCKFFFDEDANIYTIPRSKVQIIPGTVGGLGFRNWTIITTDGTKYELGAVDGAELSGGLERVRNINSCQLIFEETYNNWYLTKITPVAGELITFEYESYTVSNSGSATQTNYKLLATINAPGSSGGICTNYERECNLTTTLFSKKIKNIYFNNGSITFTQGDLREDFGGDKLIPQIIVFNKQGRIIRKWIFYQSYRSSNPAVAGSIGKRLFLDSLRLFDSQICDDAGCLPNPQLYKFQYNSELLPARNSFSQDYWGYYNGPSSQNTLAPKMVINNEYTNGNIFLDGANRLPNGQFTKSGVLEQITYPTGGYLQLEYELNDVESGLPDFFKNQRNLSYHDPALPSEDHGGVFIVNSCNSDPISVHAVATGVADPSGDPSNKQQWKFYKWNGSTWDGIAGAVLGSLTLTGTLDRIFYFGSGTYKVEMYDPTNANVPASVAIDWEDDADCFIQPAGGLRVRETKFRDGVRESDILITKYNYRKFNDQARSSGAVANFPEFHYLSKEDKIAATDPYIIDKCIYFIRNSVGNQPLATTGVGNVGYSNITVTKVKGAEQLGKTEYTFENPTTWPDGIHSVFPFAPANSNEWRRGNLIKQSDYKSIPQSPYFQLVQETVQVPETIQQENILGLKTGVDDRILSYAFGQIQDYSVAKEQFFHTGTGFNYNISTSSKVFDQANPNLWIGVGETKVINTNNYEISYSISTNSKAEIITTYIKYVSDYSISTPSGSFATAIKTLQTKNMLRLPVEKYTTKKVGTTEWVVEAELTEYNAMGLPDKIHSLNIKEPLLLSSFTVSNVDGNGAIVYDSRFKVEAYFAYDSKGNVLEQHKANDLYTKYVWDYDKELPIAECVNCNDVVAYTSFETNDYGNWTVPSNDKSAGAPTGVNYYKLSNGVITSPTLSLSKQYVVSYWSNGNGYAIENSTSFEGRQIVINGVTWKYFEHIVSNSAGFVIPGAGGIDELRIYPKEGQMNTYTHAPLIGITSKCDINNNISYFEYDAFSRLKLIREQDRNVLKTYEYKFQQTVQ